MLFVLINLILFFPKIETFLFSMNNNHIFIECGRSIIIKNHYWFLSEFLYFLNTLNQNHSINYQQIPFDHLYSVLNHILIHCQQAHQLHQRHRKNENLDQLYQWLKTQIKT
jgi:hypothetical protein